MTTTTTTTTTTTPAAALFAVSNIQQEKERDKGGESSTAARHPPPPPNHQDTPPRQLTRGRRRSGETMRRFGTVTVLLLLLVLCCHTAPAAAETINVEHGQSSSSEHTTAQQAERGKKGNHNATSAPEQDKPTSSSDEISHVHLLTNLSYVQLHNETLWLIRIVPTIAQSKAWKTVRAELNTLANLTRGLYHVGLVEASTKDGAELAQALRAATNTAASPRSSTTTTTSDRTMQTLVYGADVEDGGEPWVQWLSEGDALTLQELVNALVSATTHILQVRANAMAGKSDSTNSSHSSHSSHHHTTTSSRSSESRSSSRSEYRSSKSSSTSSSSSSSSSSPNEKQRRTKESSRDPVVVLDSSTFPRKIYRSSSGALVAFIAPWCGHCQRLQPQFRQAAQKLRDHHQVDPDTGAFFGWVDATAETQLAQTFGVRGYPTLYWFPPTATTSSDAVPYQGDRTSEPLLQFVLDALAKGGTAVVPQVLSWDDVTRHCGGPNRVCLIGFLPHWADTTAERRRSHLQLLGGVAAKHPAISVLWSEGNAQPGLEAAFQLTFGFPAVVAYSLDRGAGAVLHSSFTDKGVSTFVNAITTGKTATERVSISRDTLRTIPNKWDGKDWIVPIVEEEELSLEDIMGGDEL